MRSILSPRAAARTFVLCLAGVPLLLGLAGMGLGRLWLSRDAAAPEEICIGGLEEAWTAGATLPLRNGSLDFHRVTLTGYSSTVEETDDTPRLTASMTEVQDGCLALSRDLLRTFTPGAPFDFGDYALIPGVGIFMIQDTMNERWHERADIWFADRGAALRFGRRRAWVGRLPKPPQEHIALFAFGVRLDLQKDPLQP